MHSKYFKYILNVHIYSARSVTEVNDGRMATNKSNKSLSGGKVLIDSEMEDYSEVTREEPEVSLNGELNCKNSYVFSYSVVL